MRMRGKLIVLVIITTLFVWLPFIFRLTNPWGLDFSTGMETIWANFDGPNYLIVAKSWYNKDVIGKSFSNPLPLEYYPAHWPLFPALIGLFNLFLPGPTAMLGASLLGVVFFYLVFVEFLKYLNLTDKQVRLLVLTSLILPARWLVIRSVGSPEAWFMGFVLLSLLFYKQKKYFWAGVVGALAQLTKSPGVLLYVSFFAYEVYRLNQKEETIKNIFLNLIKTSLIPLTILVVFWFYKLRTGDFWAYFHSGDNFHLLLPPFMIFGASGSWLGDFWREEIIWLWLVYGLGLLRLLKQKIGVEVVFGIIFFTTTIFVSHRDLARYILPIMPIAILGYKHLVVKKEFVWILVFLSVPILLFSWNFLIGNVAPVADWTPYL